MKDSKKDSALYIADILNEIANIRKFVKGMDRRAFLKSELVKRAVERSIQIIGEAAKCLPSSFRDEHPEIEWRKIIAMRNIITHAYGAVDYEVVWEVVERDIQVLGKKLSTLKSRIG